MSGRKCFLQRMQRAVASESLHRDNLGPVDLHRKQQARLARLAVEQHRASAAHAMLAADMRSGETDVIPDEIHQKFARFD